MLMCSRNIKHVKVPVVYGFMGMLIHSLIILVITGFSYVLPSGYCVLYTFCSILNLLYNGFIFMV